MHQCNIAFVQLPDEADVSAELLDLLNKMLVKTPFERLKAGHHYQLIINVIIIIVRIGLAEIKEHDWVTAYGLDPLLNEEENCQQALLEIKSIKSL